MVLAYEQLMGEGFIETRERSLGRFDLFDADEVFLTGTGARMVPVGRFDGEAIGTPGVRPMTEQLDRAFGEATRELGTPF